jgi:hypothetical protein
MGEVQNERYFQFGHDIPLKITKVRHILFKSGPLLRVLSEQSS